MVDQQQRGWSTASKANVRNRYPGPGGGGEEPGYGKGGDARRKFWIKLLKETDPGFWELNAD